MRLMSICLWVLPSGYPWDIPHRFSNRVPWWLAADARRYTFSCTT